MLEMNDTVLDNRYKLIEKIGSGGMADVYKGKDLLLDRIVAVKILHSSFAADNDFITRFRHEAQAAGKLTHPNIVGIYDVGCENHVHYIVMEYVEGKTLKEYIQSHPHISIDTAVRIAIEIGTALGEAHGSGIIHCDIKPHNILLTEHHTVKVTDFGIARAINSSTVVNKEGILGSVHYLSPEQAAGDTITEKTDIYSLGIVLYEMLTHHLPFEGETAVSIALKHMQDDIPRPTKFNPSISPMLEECILTALQKDPAKRYDTVEDFISELKIAQGFTTSMMKPTEEHTFALSKPLAGEKTVKREPDREESRIAIFFSNLPQKYIWLAMASLFIICFVWAFLSFGNFWSSKEIPVPSVVGMPYEKAESELKALELKVTSDEVASDSVPVGQVISQSPSAGTKVKEKRIIHLTISKGGRVLLVPDLKGLTLDQAKNRLEKLGLTLGSIKNGNDPAEPSDTIISQTPHGGEKSSIGAQINIIVNVKQTSLVPNVIGMPLAEARLALAKQKIGIEAIKMEKGMQDSASAVVISQDPAAGEEGSMVTLTIGKKEEKKDKKGTVNITMPESGGSRHVEIYVTDDDGKKTIFNSSVKPGSTINKDVSGTGQVRVQVLIDGSVVQDREL